MKPCLMLESITSSWLGRAGGLNSWTFGLNETSLFDLKVVSLWFQLNDADCYYGERLLGSGGIGG